MPGVVNCTQVLRAILAAVPIEEINTMMTETSGPYALPGDPPVWAEYEKELAAAGLVAQAQADRKVGVLRCGRDAGSCPDDTNGRSAAVCEHFAVDWGQDGLSRIPEWLKAIF